MYNLNNMMFVIMKNFLRKLKMHRKGLQIYRRDKKKSPDE